MNKENVMYSGNTMSRYLQMMVLQENFLERIEQWLGSIEDERMRALHRFLFEIEMSETELLLDALYEYGSLLTERNYLGRKIFEQEALILRQRMQRGEESDRQAEVLTA